MIVNKAPACVPQAICRLDLLLSAATALCVGKRHGSGLSTMGAALGGGVVG